MKHGVIYGDSEADSLSWRVGSGEGSYEIYDVVVDSSHRRTGVGRRMVDSLIKLCEADGVRRIYAITRAENRIAQEWYESLNFTSRPLYDFYGVRTERGDRTVDAVMYLRDLEQYP